MEQFSVNSVSERPIYLVSVPTFRELVGRFDVTAGHFTLFVVSDASNVSADSISEVAESALQAGCVYICTWGNDCERVHDIFDEVIVGNDPNQTVKSVIMTTWHSRDTLDDALWFFLHCAWPADDYIDQTIAEIIAVVGDGEWAAQITDYLRDQHSFNSKMLEPD